MTDFTPLFLLCLAALMAGFIDSVVGDGSAFIRILFLVVVFGLMLRFGYEIVRQW